MVLRICSDALLSTQREMKLSVFLPFALSNRIPDFIPTQHDLLGELNFGHSLCESDQCPNLAGSKSYGHEDDADTISTASCSKEYKNSFLSARMDRCEYYHAEHSECVRWATEELNNECGEVHNCVETNRSNTSGKGTYWGYSSK